MLNAAQFSAAKNSAETKMLQSLVFDENKVRKGYSAFKNDAKEVTDIFNETWLRTEYDTSVRQAVTGEQFRRYRDDKDIYPYWRYLRTISLHPRDEHLKLVGNVYRIGDPEGDRVAPPDGFNCGCSTEQLSDMDMEENGYKARTSDEAREDLKDVNPQFRFNPADQGILPKESHSYFEALPNANDANGTLFNITGTSGKNITGLSAKGLHNLVEQVHKWKNEYHSDVKGNITFQNFEMYTNIIFNHKSFKNIQHNSAGFEQLADTVTNPEEVWSTWQNSESQTDTKRVYIKDNYCVSTLNGIIINAYLVDNVNRFRVGCLVG